MVGARKEMKVELQNTKSPESLPNLTNHQRKSKKEKKGDQPFGWKRMVIRARLFVITTRIHH